MIDLLSTTRLDAANDTIDIDKNASYSNITSGNFEGTGENGNKKAEQKAQKEIIDVVLNTGCRKHQYLALLNAPETGGFIILCHP